MMENDQQREANMVPNEKSNAITNYDESLWKMRKVHVCYDETLIKGYIEAYNGIYDKRTEMVNIAKEELREEIRKLKSFRQEMQEVRSLARNKRNNKE